MSLLYYLLLQLDYGQYSIGLSLQQMRAIDSWSLLVMLFLGGWYGVWLGLHWYEMVYEQGRGGFFYAFTGRLFGLLRHRSASGKASEPLGNHRRWEVDDLIPEKTSMPAGFATKRVVKMTGSKPARSKAVPEVASSRSPKLRVRKVRSI
jgi:hypothetical protein